MMNKAELQELTRLGVQRKLEQVQRYLAKVHQEFPEMFATPTPPVFMRAEEKREGNSWPTFTASMESENGNGAEAPTPKRIWSPARRAAAAARMRARPPRTATGPWGTVVYQRIHDFLATRPQREARIVEIATALKVLPATTRSAIVIHKELFRHHGGVVRLIKAVNTPKRKHSTKSTRTAVASHTSTKKAAPKIWGAAAWHRMHDFLATQPDQTAGLQAIMPACKITTQAGAITGMQSHADIFQRSSPGTYRLKRALSADDKLQYAPGH
jgi:hypothetical protein